MRGDQPGSTVVKRIVAVWVVVEQTVLYHCRAGIGVLSELFSYRPAVAVLEYAVGNYRIAAPIAVYAAAQNASSVVAERAVSDVGCREEVGGNGASVLRS